VVSPIHEFVGASLVFVAVAALLAPTARYLTVGWFAKRKDIMDGLGSSARLMYFQMFSPSELPDKTTAAANAFEAMYTKWYGRRLYLVPACILTAVAIISVALVILTSLDERVYLTNPFFNLEQSAVAAIAGAYLWVLNDHISRARRLDFSPSDLAWASLRFIVAIPMGYAFAAVASESSGPFIAFALGAFPLTGVLSILRRLGSKRLGLGDTDDEMSDDINKLQGINKVILERLANEDVLTVTQIAYCDPVRLTMRSNLSFNFITDCMGQALVWMYLEEGLNCIRPLGLRGAYEIKCLIDEFDEAEGSPARSRALSAMPLYAKALQQDQATVQIAFRQIAEDPFTVFLYNVWYGDPTSPTN